MKLPKPLLAVLSPAKLASTVGIALLGLFCYTSRLGAPLERLSFDLPFAFRTNMAAPDVALIYLDEESARELKQPLDDIWDRALHTKLLNRLTHDGCALVYYDIIFGSPGSNAKTDADFAQAMQANQHVILSGAFEAATQGGSYSERSFPPLPLFRQAAAGWGLALFPIDPDFGVRELGTGTADIPSASWVAAEKLGASVTKNPANRLDRRWLNFCGPSGTIATVSFYQALYQDGVAPGYFKNKIVLIGGHPAVGGLNLGRDLFATPYSRWGRLFSPGLELHATELINLLRGNWMKRIPPAAEILAVILFGLAFGIIGNYFTPKPGILIGLGLALLLSAITIAAFFSLHLWWNWLVAVGVQMPLALVWSSGSQYFQEARRRAALRQAFAYYLSPHMAKKIADLDFDLKPGGKVLEATILFTDCKGFTSVSEELHDPQKLSELLIEYFTQTSRCVLDNGGTIIKYIGDSVMAAWGAPLEDPDHPRKAAKAAWELSEASKLVVKGRVLTTRVGVSTGEVLAGNLGSAYRFDYTCIGDTTNLASRLEGMNKMLGTSVLISESTHKHLQNEFWTRLTGYFAVAGKSHGIAVYEIVGPRDGASAAPGWVACFDEALEAIKTGQFEDAKRLLRKTIWERSGEDGPSQFYLKKMADLEKADKLLEWTGVVRLDEK